MALLLWLGLPNAASELYIIAVADAWLSMIQQQIMEVA